MFIGYYELDNEKHFAIYSKNKEGVKSWKEDTFSPNCKNIKILDFKISGYEYRERQESLVELAKKWQYEFSHLGWSYSELAAIEDWFYVKAKRYGVLNEFNVNGIC